MSEEDKAARPSNEVLQRQYDEYKSVLQQMGQKIGELETDSDEHRAVLESLQKCDPDRQCFRMIGGVLVEKKVGEVIPSLETNHEGLKTAIKNIASDYKKKDEEMQEWRKKYNVQVVKSQ